MFKHILRSAAQIYDVDKVSRETARMDDEVDMCIATGMPPDRLGSRTVQSAKDDADINVIVKRFGVTKMMPTSARVPSYGDYTGVNDFQTAMNVIREAEEAFMTLPADTRSRFGNDPQAYLEFCSNPDNIGEMVKMGLANKPRKPDNIPAPDVPGKEKSNVRRDSAKRAEKADQARRGSEENSGGESEGA